MHFYDARYPTAASATLFPPDASVDQYRQVQQDLGLERVVVVQPTTYGLDNSLQLDAMATFGDQARGVMVVNADVPDHELHRLTALGVRGARFHMLPGGAVEWNDLRAVADKIEPFGWHIQLQLNGHEIEERYDQLAGLDTGLVIDHIGRFMPPVETAHVSFQALTRLLESGNVWVKLSAPYESSPDTSEVEPLVQELVSRFSDRLLWATNWPHPGQDPTVTTSVLADQLHQWLPNAELLNRVLVTNPAAVYWAT